MGLPMFIIAMSQTLGMQKASMLCWEIMLNFLFVKAKIVNLKVFAKYFDYIKVKGQIRALMNHVSMEKSNQFMVIIFIIKIKIKLQILELINLPLSTYEDLNYLMVYHF